MAASRASAEILREINQNLEYVYSRILVYFTVQKKRNDDDAHDNDMMTVFRKTE